MSSIKTTLECNMKQLSPENAKIIRERLEKNINLLVNKIMNDRNKCHKLYQKIDNYYRSLNDIVVEMIIDEKMGF